tara:strand:- start:4562 stop:5275 length:714 start_codon:yes stop_codon:yes gene_type:complete
MNPSIMLRTDKDFVFDIPSDTLPSEYTLNVNDRFSFRLFSKDGFQIIDITSFSGGTVSGYNFAQTFQYTIEPDSTTKLPIIGKQKVAGKTIRQIERFLEEKYAAYYNDPFVMVNVVNRRVFVFTGQDGKGEVITLSNENTTLIEGLALAGGISEDGKSHKIKLIRGYNTDDAKVFQFDLSTIDGIHSAGMILQANDIIYVEPQVRVARDVLREVTPIVSLITSTIVVIAAFDRLSAR